MRTNLIMLCGLILGLIFIPTIIWSTDSSSSPVETENHMSNWQIMESMTKEEQQEYLELQRNTLKYNPQENTQNNDSEFNQNKDELPVNRY